VTSNFSTDQFFYSAPARCFDAEASELGLKPGVLPAVIDLKSALTGTIMTFRLEYIEEDGSMRFLADAISRETRGVSLVIIND
jgi:hypothetical protein